MSLHHLDPRQAGTGAAADIEVKRRRSGNWTAYSKNLPDGQMIIVGDTESDALHAARTAAGFGHVAERACDDFRCLTCHCANGADCSQCEADCEVACSTCAWSRDAHTEGGK